MKILWVKTDFLHPTTRGGQIRTLEMLRQLHRSHEVHYIAFDDLSKPEGLQRSSEYCRQAYPIRHKVVPKRSLGFAGQLVKGLLSPLPVAGTRYASRAMREAIAKVSREHRFDAKVCDFLTPSININDMSDWILFQHNVETVIWERHAASGRTPLHRAYFGLQARRMFDWERSVCQTAAHVVTVSETDEQMMKERFGIRNTSSVATGVDLDYFERPSSALPGTDLVFIGSMDWMPNIDGVRWFLEEVLPLVREQKPDCSLTIVGRNPPAAIREMARDSRVNVTGTVPDVRSYLWSSAVSIVPLRIGGGTRLKIYEAMAAGTPLVSTAIGAEGLPLQNGDHISIADDPADFAAACLDLLTSADARNRMAQSALSLVRSRFSWEQIAKQFEQTLASVNAPVSENA